MKVSSASLHGLYVPFVLLLINNPSWLYHSLLGQSIGLLWHFFSHVLITLVKPVIGFPLILIIFSFQSWLFSNLLLTLWLFLKPIWNIFHALHCCTLLLIILGSSWRWLSIFGFFWHYCVLCQCYLFIEAAILGFLGHLRATVNLRDKG